jgi:hypothetical protein
VTVAKAHCFFEQSGTFKNEFRKLGIPAEDYDIQNNFGETDHVVDLFAEIERAYDGGASLFDEIGGGDLIFAFFPCIYFCGTAQINITLANYQFKFHTLDGAGDYILRRVDKRTEFYKLLVKLCCVCVEKKLRLIVENPWTTNTYLKGNFIAPPSVIDEDRTRRGDSMVKPTAYWYFNCEPTFLVSFQPTPEEKRRYIDIHTNHAHKRDQVLKGSKVSGICSEERSMISPDYARNFICDFILGKEQAHTQPELPLFA